MSCVVRIQNDYSQLITSNQEVMHKLYLAMRIADPQRFFRPAYRQKRWDGYTNFFNLKTGKFLTGLLPDVLRYLKYEFQVPYQINDLRQAFAFRHKEITADFLNQWNPTKQINLYDYQVDLITAAAKYKRGIVQAPTGSGKTFVFIGIMRALPPNTPTLVLTDTIDLTEQNYDELVKANFKNVGRLHGKKKSPNVITCSTVQSVKKLEHVFPHIRALIVDEAHACMSAVPVSIYRKLKHTPVRIAISATPFTDPEQEYKLKGYFGPLFRTQATDTGVLTTKELQERGILSGSNCFFHEVNEPQIPYEVFQDAVKFGLAENPYFLKLVKKLALGMSGRTLILVERLVQGDSLAAMIPNSFWIQGEDHPDLRKKVIQKLKTSNEVIAIVSQKIISKGLDVKVHNLINAAGGKAKHSIIQRMGRGLRTAEDKDILNYHDFLFNINGYLRDHSEERIKCLKREGHPIIIVKAPLPET